MSETMTEAATVVVTASGLQALSRHRVGAMVDGLASPAAMDEFFDRAMAPSWLGQLRETVRQFCRRLKSTVARVRGSERERTREHRALVEGNPSAYDGERDPADPIGADDSSELSSIIDQYGD